MDGFFARPGYVLFLWVVCPGFFFLGECVAGEPVERNSGHHFAADGGGQRRDGAAIGLDFGRNPFPGGSPVNFMTQGGRRRLERALGRAVEAREARMSFDLGFDFRSVVVRGADGRPALDEYVAGSVEAFLEALEAADRSAAINGLPFRADVVLADYRMADGVSQEWDASRQEQVQIGEHPEYITDAELRGELMAALRPVFEKLGGHPLVTLNLMNEPEFISMPALEAAARIEGGRWAQARLGGGLEGRLAKAGVRSVAQALRGMGADAYVTVRRDPRAGGVTLFQAALVPGQVMDFLLAMRSAILEASPGARVTVGWADDRSAMANTAALEQRAGGEVVTDVISFHVYARNGHPLTTVREDFVRAFGERRVRITEWGIYRPGNLSEAILEALQGARDAGFEGVLFWWDQDYAFGYTEYRAAWEAYSARKADFNGDGRVDLGDFVMLARAYGSVRGGPDYNAGIDLDGDGRIGFADFVAFARAYGG